MITLDDLKTLDWLDILLHVGAGALGVGVATTIGLLEMTTAIALNALVWFVREGVQSYRRGKSINPASWSVQKHAEWIAPALAAPLLVILY